MTRRLLLSYLTIAAIVLVVLEVPLAVFYQQRETDRLSVDVERDATQLASRYEDALEHEVPLQAQPAAAYARRTGARVVVTGARGWSLLDTAGPPGRDFATRPEVRTSLDGRITAGTRHSRTLGTDLLYVAVPVASGGHVHGVVRVTMETSAVNALVRRFWLGLAAIAVVVLVAVAAIGWAVARSVSRPIRSLRAAADRFSRGDLTPSPPDPDAPAEVAALAATMDTMARRLDQLLRQHRAFVADASHQLRTPLTALRLRLENVQSDLEHLEAGQGDGGAEELGAAIDETDRLSLLVGDLLRLARAEEAASPQLVDLAQLARERVDTWSAIAGTSGVTLQLVAPSGPLPARVVPAGIEQIMDNLIDNALAASPPGSRVTVTVRRGNARHSLRIEDEGLGLSDDAKALALDRFWRGDHTTPGTGLGLPIARALAEASGGSLQLQDGASGGLAVIVTLPAAASRAAAAARLP